MTETRPRPTIIGTETLFKGWGRYLRARVRLPDGQVVSREVEDHGDAAAILPYDPERRVATLVRQLRAPMLLAGDAEDLLEAPAGLLDGDDPETCAIREAAEEVGLALSGPERVGTCAGAPGSSTERVHLFLCAYRESDRTTAGGGLATEQEFITVVELPLAFLAEAADAGRLADMKTLALVQTLRLRRPDLFRPA